MRCFPLFAEERRLESRIKLFVESLFVLTRMTGSQSDSSDFFSSFRWIE